MFLMGMDPLHLSKEMEYSITKGFGTQMLIFL